jgi:hypothetical protein
MLLVSVNSVLLVPLVLWSVRTIREATMKRKTAAHVTMLWKHRPLNWDDAPGHWVGPSIKGGGEQLSRVIKLKNLNVTKVAQH